CPGRKRDDGVPSPPPVLERGDSDLLRAFGRRGRGRPGHLPGGEALDPAAYERRGAFRALRLVGLTGLRVLPAAGGGLRGVIQRPLLAFARGLSFRHSGLLWGKTLQYGGPGFGGQRGWPKSLARRETSILTHGLGPAPRIRQGQGNVPHQPSI